LDNELLRLAFSMDKPDSFQRFDGFSHPDGRYSIIELSAILSSVSDQDAAKVKALTASQSASEFQSILKLLASRSEVVRTPVEDLQ
jgi:hypothetical protein